jgi:hypothetical protein
MTIYSALIGSGSFRASEKSQKEERRGKEVMSKRAGRTKPRVDCG